MSVEARVTGHTIARKRGQAKEEQKDTRVQAKALQVLALDVEETIGSSNAPEEERKEVERPAMEKEVPVRAKEKGSTTWGSQVLRKIHGQDHQG